MKRQYVVAFYEYDVPALLAFIYNTDLNGFGEYELGFIAELGFAEEFTDYELELVPEDKMVYNGLTDKGVELMFKEEGEFCSYISIDWEKLLRGDYGVW